VLRALGKTAFAHNWLNLAIAVPYSLIPVLVTVIISPSANAAFYVAWMLSGFVYIIPQHLSTVLFAVAAAEPQVIARKLRFTLKVSLLVGLPASVVLGFGAHLGLSLFGAGYAKVATFPLIMLAFGYLPNIPKVHYIAVCRAIGKVSRAALVLTTFAAIEVTAAAMGGLMDGLIGLSWALLIVAVVEGIATTPAVVRAAIARGRHRRPVVMAEPAGAAVATAGDEATYRDQRAQQEAGLAVLLSLATTVGPDHPIPEISYTLSLQARAGGQKPVL
jgi:O-antigen/teichoic acid export membrane protein